MLQLINDIKSSTVASFKLNGERIDIIPDQMIKSANSYSKKIKNLLVVLNIETVVENMYRWTVTLKNTGDAPTGQITDFYGIDLDIPVHDEVCWESINGDRGNGESFMPFCVDVTDGFERTVEAQGGRSSQGTFPYFDVTCGADTVVFAVGWTGQWKYTLSRSGDSLRVLAGFADCDMYLNKNESIRSVGALVYAGKGVLKTRQDFRRIFREKLSLAAATDGKLQMPVCLQVFDRYYWSMPEWRTQEGQMRCIDQSEKCEYFNTFWIDAAWFREGFPFGVGNYTFNPGLPDGLTPISDRVHKLGYRFMVWFEPERNYFNSDTVLHHKEYMMSKENSGQFLFNLADDEARNWIRDTLVRIIRENGIDIYRQDFNMDPLNYWRDHDAVGRKGYTENKYITGLYRLFDDLLEEFPGLIIDNCASGGRRLDFEMNIRSVPAWRSDTNCSGVSPDHPNHYWHQNQNVTLSRYLPYHSGGVWDTKAFMFRSSATMGVACNLPVLDEDFDISIINKPLAEMSAIKGYWDGDVYPLADITVDNDTWFAYQYDNNGEGFCVFFRRENSEEAQKLFNINCIDPSKEYEISLSNEQYDTVTQVVRGCDLISYTAHIPQKLASLMMVYKVKE